MQETLHIAVGVLIADVVMCVIFALCRRFDDTVVLGALLGTVFAVGNFFLLGLTVQKAVERAKMSSASCTAPTPDGCFCMWRASYWAF